MVMTFFRRWGPLLKDGDFRKVLGPVFFRWHMPKIVQSYPQ